MTDPTDTLVVDVNREGVRSLDVPDRIEVDRSFTVELRNHGESTHVHLHLDDALSEVARLRTGNHHVPGESTRPVDVAVGVPQDGEYPTVRGKLKVVVGYGQLTHYVDVVVDLSKHAPVEVDPDLATPSADRADGGARRAPRSADGALDTDRLSLEGSGLLRALPAVVLGVVAVLLAAAAITAPGSSDLSFGIFAVVTAVLTAAYLLITG